MFDFQCREHGFGAMCFDTHPHQRPRCNESHSSFTQQNRRITAQNGVDLACGAAKISSNIGTYPLSTYAAREPFGVALQYYQYHFLCTVCFIVGLHCWLGHASSIHPTTGACIGGVLFDLVSSYLMYVHGCVFTVWQSEQRLQAPSNARQVVFR